MAKGHGLTGARRAFHSTEVLGARPMPPEARSGTGGTSGPGPRKRTSAQQRKAQARRTLDRAWRRVLPCNCLVGSREGRGTRRKKDGERKKARRENTTRRRNARDRSGAHSKAYESEWPTSCGIQLHSRTIRVARSPAACSSPARCASRRAQLSICRACEQRSVALCAQDVRTTDANAASAVPYMQDVRA